MRVRLTADARGDLRLIARWIGRDNRERAKSYSSELRRACASLSHHPARFPVVATLAGDEVRKRVHGDYLIFYRIGETEVEVLRIVHGAPTGLPPSATNKITPQKVSPDVNEAYRRFSFPLYFCFTHRREKSRVALGRGRALWPTGNPPVP